MIKAGKVGEESEVRLKSVRGTVADAVDVQMLDFIRRKPKTCQCPTF